MSDIKPTPPIFCSSNTAGYSRAVLEAPLRVTARKRPVSVQVHFAPHDCLVQTLEGTVKAKAGDAIVTGTAGERWPVAREQFAVKYAPLAPCLAGSDGLYQSLPTEVLALPMQVPFFVVLNDGHTRLAGQAGDWLVDYGDGTLGIVAKAIFATIYATDPR